MRELYAAFPLAGLLVTQDVQIDATTAYNQWNVARRYQPRGVALWHLGVEDPGVWSVIGKDALLNDSGRAVRQQGFHHQDAKNAKNADPNSFGGVCAATICIPPFTWLFIQNLLY